MFEWFKRKKEDDVTIYNNIRLAYQSLELALKAVENHWKIGNKKEGDRVLASFLDVCKENFIGGPANRPVAIHTAQFEGLKEMLQFLQKHKLSGQVGWLVAEIVKQRKEFDVKQLEYLVVFTKLTVESENAAKSNEQNTRLVYYVCQRCGKTNLISTAPCLHCGFAATNELTYRRSLLLCSVVMQTPALLSLAEQLQIGFAGSPPQRLDDIWRNVDSIAKKQTEQFNSHFEQLLRKSVENSKSYNGPPELSMQCIGCRHQQDIQSFNKEQICINCGEPINIPHLRRLKAALDESLTLLIWTAVHNEEVEYANFFAAYIELVDYILRRDAPPNKGEFAEFLRRFASISPLKLYKGQCELSVIEGTVSGVFLENCTLDDEQKLGFEAIQMILRSVIEMCESDELPA